MKIVQDEDGDSIYEKLAPDELFIISLRGDTLLYVVNRLGTAHLQQATLEE